MRRPRTAFRILLAAFILYAAAYIFRTSFVVDNERYFALFDDAMVSMRYAHNLARGFGLIWDPIPGGERVEGFTNPLWTFYMAALHWLPLPPAWVSLLVQVTGALALLANLVFVRRVADLLSGGSERIALCAVALTAFYAPLNNWGLMGMEVSALTLMVTVAVWLALRALRDGTASLRLYLLLGVATLVRMDAVVAFVAIWAFLLAAARGQRRRHLLYGLACLAFFLVLQTGLRLWYYGDPLPNTYYLKLTGFPLVFRLTRGLYVFLLFVWRMNWVLFLIPLAVLLFRRDRFVFLPLWVFFAQVAYSVYVGGDAWESWGGANRYLCLAMPLFFVMLAYALGHFVEHADPGFTSRRRLVTLVARPVYDLRILAALLVLATGLSFLTGQFVDSPAAPGMAPETALIVAGGGILLIAVLWALRRWGGGLARLPARVTAPASLVMGGFVLLALVNLNAIYGPSALAEWLLLREPAAVTDNRQMVQLYRALDPLISRQAKVAVVLAGVLPYFADRPVVDLMGKSDRVIAHEESRPLPSGISPLVGFWPGHTKWDYAHSIGAERPDVVAQLWWMSAADAQPYLERDYRAVDLAGLTAYLREGSPNILPGPQGVIPSPLRRGVMVQ